MVSIDPPPPFYKSPVAPLKLQTYPLPQHSAPYPNIAASLIDKRDREKQKDMEQKKIEERNELLFQKKT